MTLAFALIQYFLLTLSRQCAIPHWNLSFPHNSRQLNTLSFYKFMYIGSHGEMGSISICVVVTCTPPTLCTPPRTFPMRQGRKEQVVLTHGSLYHLVSEEDTALLLIQ